MNEVFKIKAILCIFQTDIQWMLSEIISLIEIWWVVSLIMIDNPVNRNKNVRLRKTRFQSSRTNLENVSGKTI